MFTLISCNTSTKPLPSQVGGAETTLIHFWTTFSFPYLCPSWLPLPSLPTSPSPFPLSPMNAWQCHILRGHLHSAIHLHTLGGVRHQRLAVRGRHVLFGCNSTWGAGLLTAPSKKNTDLVWDKVCVLRVYRTLAFSEDTSLESSGFTFCAGGMTKKCMFRVGRQSERMWEISLSCWSNRHIFQDVAACGPRLCLSRMTPFASIYQRPARPPLTLGLRLWVWDGRKRGRDRSERSDGM